MLYRYGIADPDAAGVAGLPATASHLGELASRSDRASKTLFAYDARGRASGVAKRIVKRGTPSDALATRYAPRWYTNTATYDGADRPVETGTGARVPELLGTGATSAVTTSYTKRGAVRAVGGSYGTLVTSVKRAADGLTRETKYGDLAQTTTAMSYDGRRRVSAIQTFRSAPGAWSTPPPEYLPAPLPGAGTSQLLLQDTEFTYDEVDNPIAIRDFRNPAEWPTGAKPVHRGMRYDDLYRVTRVDYGYVGDDEWISPFQAENQEETNPRRPKPVPHQSFPKRVTQQTFAYDWLGNTTKTDDDQHGFYDRSLGNIQNGSASLRPYALTQAASAEAGPRSGSLSAAYDAAGNLTSLAVSRSGPCEPTGFLCSHRFAYDWDEVGQLVRAVRWDLVDPGLATDPLPEETMATELLYAYDATGARVRKTSYNVAGDEAHTVYVFGSLELRRAAWESDGGGPGVGDYEDSVETETVYLFANGVRLARLAYDADAPALGGTHLHVFLQLGDHLGSSEAVLDKATGELVERSTYQPYGAAESDYRPERWGKFREDYRFTGKEEDVEVGLQYFGARYYLPLLGRWASADPLAIHGLGADLNVYAYVHGRVFGAVDPWGLDDVANHSEAPPDAKITRSDSGGTVRMWETSSTGEKFKALATAVLSYFGGVPYDPNGSTRDRIIDTFNGIPGGLFTVVDLEKDKKSDEDALNEAASAVPRMLGGKIGGGGAPKTKPSEGKPPPSPPPPAATAPRTQPAAKATPPQAHQTPQQQQQAQHRAREAGRGGAGAAGAGPAAPMLGARGPQVTSQTLYKGSAGRIDVENPAPGSRPGQIHFQKGNEKYLYDPATRTFPGAPNRVNDLLRDPKFQAGIEKALRFLGER